MSWDLRYPSDKGVSCSEVADSLYSLALMGSKFKLTLPAFPQTSQRILVFGCRRMELYFVEESMKVDLG